MKGCEALSEVSLLPINGRISGELEVPGDKSISHRAVMLGSLAKGHTKVENFLDGDDCMHTIDAFTAMGVKIEQNGTQLHIESNGYKGFTEPALPLYFGNSGTTARLMIGLLAGLPFFTTIYGDPYLSNRPMDRVITPLKEMGLLVDGRSNGSLLPLSIRGARLTGMRYKLPVKSAQVKSAILLAGLFADGETTVIENGQTRDHTEVMLKAFGADIRQKENEIIVTNKGELKGIDVVVPGDISSAAFFLAAAAIVSDSQLTLRNVGLNETRTGIVDVLMDMGANLTISNERTVNGEVIGDIHIEQKPLNGTIVEGSIIPRLIDEIPIIALLATQAEGKTIIKDAEELRVKETDRIEAVVEILTTLGANITATKDGMIIEGKTPLTGGKISSYHDHRMAMLGAVASLITNDAVIIDDTSSISVSYPSFFSHLKQLIK